MGKSFIGIGNSFIVIDKRFVDIDKSIIDIGKCTPFFNIHKSYLPIG